MFNFKLSTFKPLSWFKENVRLFTWFEKNIDQAYRYAIRIALLIWLSLILIVVFLIVCYLRTRDPLPLSALAISLSAIIASLMAWYNIETVKRVALKNEEKAAHNDFIRFYTYSFSVYRALNEAVNYKEFVLPEEIPQMVIFTVEQYLVEYPRFAHFHLLLNANEKRIVAENIFTLPHSVAKLKRATRDGYAQITKESIKEAQESMRWIIERALKRSFDALDFSKQFNNNVKMR